MFERTTNFDSTKTTLFRARTRQATYTESTAFVDGNFTHNASFPGLFHSGTNYRENASITTPILSPSSIRVPTLIYPTYTHNRHHLLSLCIRLRQPHLLTFYHEELLVTNNKKERKMEQLSRQLRTSIVQETK